MNWRLVMAIGNTAPDNRREGGILGHIAFDLAEAGWSVCDHFLAPTFVSQLAVELQDLWSANGFRPAGVGRGGDFRVDSAIRCDQVHWFDPCSAAGARSVYLDTLDELRRVVNGTLFLGLFDFEGHFAVYPPGGYYRRHLDRFAGAGDRALTCILYLNDGWEPEHGGQLRLYTDPAHEERYEEILPVGGRLVSFLSDRFPHEVLPATRDRLSVTGWFKQRPRAL